MVPGAALPAISAAAVRDFLLQSAEVGEWSSRDAARLLGIDPKAARQALAVLETTGYVEPVPRAKDKWRNTAAGNAMAGVSAAKPLKRDTAADKLDEFLERAAAVNHDPHYLYAVKRAVLYGPYLNPEARLRNVDIAVELAPREKNKTKHEERVKRRAEEAAAAGKRFTSFAARRNWGRQEVLDFLKSRSRTIAITELAPWILSQPHKDLL